ncbi:pyruvate dehydrogenase (acetyl-transferring) E1 component subunit alpha [Streptomyces sp. MZ04]|uniref:pyruvate dehydrogenase (acetyl-transferring) E1 component subunit alpha n=1 Tax=Streptomyces sp. MZ04 TaxID=2559236 RepID=UPI00107EAF06|nr:pyruvate dehydrogenase (acetyl-transferring) E1 component subunit alpha [Streptomyces sp. MZ04]TGB14812.1 pyruvate dehydrogenase (acetyl-transferring) E1 component subunit alpha [Streptomyces sp. MZ04]
MKATTALPDLESVLAPLALMSPEGVPVAEPPFDVSLTPEELTGLYEWMFLTRALDEEFIHLQRQGQLALYPSCRGQEAAQIGCAAALRADDWLFPQYRELGMFLWRGIPAAGVGAVWRGTWHGGGWGFTEHACAPLSIPIGTQALHAVGAAMAAPLRGEDSLAVALIGDGATSEGDVHEALNFAAVTSAPCLFYVQNNQWAISVPLSEQTRAPSLAHKAVGYGMPGVRVDGNDVLACYAVTEQAARRAREGGGPTLIEAVTYRMAPHTTADDPSRYRSQEEVDHWAALDPLPRFRRYLTHRDLWRAETEERVRARAEQMCAELRDGVFDAPDVAPSELFAHVLKEQTPELREQAAQLRAELAREE